MNDVEKFLAYSIRLEQEAALRFDELADALGSHGNKDVADFFRQLANYSRLHLGQAMARGGFRDIPTISPEDFDWPDDQSPEAAAIWGADPNIHIHQALQLALDAEQQGMNFYKSIFETTTDPEVRAFAKEFAEEEAEHVEAIQKWIKAVSK
jgi:rubrerythrin